MTFKKYGLIGCGMMGAEHIRNVNLLAGARFSVVYDELPDNAARAATLAGGARIASTASDLIADPQLDAIVICSPNRFHVEQLEAIAAARALPILCEKPLYTRAEDAGRVARLAKNYSAPVWVAMEYRYMPPVQAFIEEASGVTGGIRMLSVREHRFAFLKKFGDWNRFNQNTGGTLVEKCCHFFDLMRLITGAEPVRVMASAGQMVNYKDELYNGRVPDIWDGAYVIFEFSNGARALLELCMFADGTKWNEEITGVGPNGKIECRVPGPHRFWPEQLGAPPIPELSLYPRNPRGPVTRQLPINLALASAGDHHGSTFHQHRKFFDVVCGRGSVEVTLADGAKAVAMGLAAQEAARSGRVIDLA